MNRNVKIHFDNLSSKYRENFSGDKSGKSFEFGRRAELVERLVKGAAGSLLDCACGTGEITSKALRAGSFSDATLIDISCEMLLLSKAHFASFGNRIQYVQSDIYEYQPPSRKQFDIILCLGLIAHTGNLKQLLTQLKSMLLPNGVILLQTSVADHWGVRAVRHFTAKRYAQRHGYGISYFRICDIEDACNESGLVVKESKRYCFGFPFGDKIFALGNYWLETTMQGISAKGGSEVICVLRHYGDDS